MPFGITMGEKKTVICFEGVNNQIWKIQSRFNEKQVSVFKKYCERAKKYLGIDFHQQLLDGKSCDKLKNAYNELNLTYISNCAILEFLLDSGVEPDAFVGYSLGVNSACVCSDAISYEDGLEINRLLFKSMCYSFEKFDYAMSLVVGFSEDTLREIFSGFGYDHSIVDIASANSPYSFLLVGNGTALDKMGQYFMDKGAILVNKIESYIPFHYNMKEKWLTDNVDKFANFKVREMRYKVFSPYKYRYLDDGKEVIDELINNVYSRINWEKAVQSIEGMNYRAFVDVSITGSNKRITQLNNEESRFYTLKNYKLVLEKDQR